MKKYTHSLKVRSYELDAQGHVNYAVYLNYLEYARVATMEQVGMPFQDFLQKGKFVVIVEANIKYLAPATLGDELEITLEGIKAGRTSITFKQEIFTKIANRKILESQLVAVFINQEGKPIPMDVEFRRVFFDD